LLSILCIVCICHFLYFFKMIYEEVLEILREEDKDDLRNGHFAERKPKSIRLIHSSTLEMGKVLVQLFT